MEVGVCIVQTFDCGLSTRNVRSETFISSFIGVGTTNTET